MKRQPTRPKSETGSITRRRFVKTAGAAAALAAGAPFVAPKRVHAADPIEILHWNWLGASDKEVWSQMIDAFNDAHKDKGIQIKMEDVAFDQYKTKILASVATGRAPDFGWGIAGADAKFARDGVTVPLDETITAAGLDLADFTENSLKAARYPQSGNQLHMVPMDLMSLQPEINLDHVAEAGLDPENPPQDWEGAARMGGCHDPARRRHRHPLRNHDDRLGRAADRDLGDRRRADGLPARERGLEAGLPEPRRRQGSDAVGARSLRRAPGLHP